MAVIRSMTGFAAAQGERDGGRVQITLRAVNHRFLDVALKAPAIVGEAEARVRGDIQRRLARGRVEVAIGLELATATAPEVTLDVALLESVASAIETARIRGLVTGALTASDVLRIPHLLNIDTRSGDRTPARLPPDVTALIEDVLGQALDALIGMRETEGQFLHADLDGRLATIENLVDELERLSHEGQRDLEARLRERIAALPVDLQLDPAALAQEVVRFLARSDVDEEVVRLRSHIDHWRLLAGGPEPCGRKLDFLVQEINRELNTIGSKIEGARATETVIAAKAELERIREQVQNVE
jgi:uncharacterized protein (TIGR00255 family)